jgi:hypothetical protein
VQRTAVGKIHTYVYRSLQTATDCALTNALRESPQAIQAQE